MAGGGYLIDPPSPFTTLKAWRAFKQELDSLGDPDDPAIRGALEQDGCMIARLEHDQT
jgi:hypothetical protein